MNSSIGVQSRDEQRRKLKEMINRDDFFDVWLRWVLEHAPSVYVFINITLLIWIAQTIFNSKLSSIPSSIFLIAPFFTLGPITSITAINASSNCSPNQTLLSLRSIPTIRGTNITHRELNVWGEPAIQFCVQRLSFDDRISQSCSASSIKCSGYCVKSASQCPITNIKMCSSNVVLQRGYEKFATINSKIYCLSRDENTPIVSLMAPFTTKCANDEHYNQVYDTEGKFWQAAIDCKQEGTIRSFYTKIESMETNTFLANNKVPLTVTDQKLKKIQLGSVSEFAFSINAKDGCADAALKSQSIKQYLQKGPISPQFTQPLLIIAFILLVGEVCWLIAYYCFTGFTHEKNIFVGLISIIELVIISFIYSQNQQLFYVEQLSSTLARCLLQSLPAMTQWNFGISSPQVFKMVIFLNTAFLGLFITVSLLDSYCFKELKRRPPGSQAYNRYND